jgi:hypothetical protein
VHRVPPLPKVLKQAAEDTAGEELFFGNPPNGE